MVKLQRQLALDPDAVPEPPVDDIQSLWPMALRLCAVAGVAARRPVHDSGRDLGGARRAAFDVGGQTCRVGWFELVEQERIDQGTGACAVEGVANRRVRHIPYMT